MTFAEGSMTMPESNRGKERPVQKKRPSTGKNEGRKDVMEEEEKILAGRTDVNMPALLTKDVPGG